MKKKTKNQAAVELGKRRWAGTTKEQRTEITKNAVSKRTWRPIKKSKA